MKTLVDKQCDSMQEVMTYASAATILGLGFDMSLIKIVNEADSQVRYIISIYDEMEERKGDLKTTSKSPVTDQFELGTGNGKTGMYL